MKILKFTPLFVILALSYLTARLVRFLYWGKNENYRDR